MSKYTLAAAVLGAGLAFSSAAQADCSVTNSDKRGTFGGEQRFSRQFSGDSAATIWERYCKPFIQRTVAEERIQNGSFAMRCTGRISCNVEGTIAGGRVRAPSVLRLDR